MGFLTKPVPTDSYQSWEDIAGGTGVFVQRRTAEGMRKNGTIAHRLRYTAADLFHFRIVVLPANVPAIEPTPGKAHTGDTALQKAPKRVVATAQTQREIMADWEIISASVATVRDALAGWNADTVDAIKRARPDVSRAGSEASFGTAAAPVMESREPSPAAAAPESVPDVDSVIQSPLLGSTAALPVQPETAEASDASDAMSHPTAGEMALLRALRPWNGTSRAWSLAFAALLLHGAVRGYCGVALVLALTVLAAAIPSSCDAATVEASVQSLRAAWFVAWGGASGTVAWLLAAIAALNFAVEIFSAGSVSVVSFLDLGIAPMAAVCALLAAARPVQPPREPSPVAPAPAVVAAPPVASKPPPPPQQTKKTAPTEEVRLPQSIRIALECLTATPWGAAKKEQGRSSFYSAKVPWCKQDLVKVTTFVPGLKARAVYATLHDDPDGAKGKQCNAFTFDTLLTDRSYHGPGKDENEFHWHCKYKSPVWGVSARDFALLACPGTLLNAAQQKEFGLQTDGECYIFASRNDSAFPPCKGFIRGTLHRYGVIAIERPGGCEIINVLANESGGSLPTSVCNAVNFEQINKVELIGSVALDTQKRLGQLPCPALVAPAPVADTAPAVTAVAPSELPLPDTVERVLHLWKTSEGEWQPHTMDKRSVSLLTKPSPWCDKKALHAETFIPGATARHVDGFLNDDPECTRGKESSTFKYDRLLVGKHLIRNENGALVLKTEYKSPVFGIKARDMVNWMVPAFYLSPAQQETLQCKATGGRGEVFIMSAKDFGTRHPEDPKYARGAAHCYGIIAMDAPGGSVVHMFLSMDPQGSIPARVVEVTHAEQHTKLALIRELIMERLAAQSLQEAVPPGGEPEPQPPAPAEAQAEAPAAGCEKDSEAVPEQILKALELWHCDGWVKKDERKQTLMKVRPSPWCDKKAIWLTTKTVPGVQARAFEDMMCDDPDGTNLHSNSYKFDRLLARKFFIGAPSPLVRTWRTEYKSPVWGVQPRDMANALVPTYYFGDALQRQHFGDDPTIKRVWAQAAFDAPEVPAEPKFQRARTHSYGIFVIERATGCEVHYVLSFDPCGSIPGRVVELTNAEQLEKLVLMRELATAQQ